MIESRTMKKDIIIGGNLELLPKPYSDEALKLEVRIEGVAQCVKTGKTKVIDFGGKKFAITSKEEAIEVVIAGQGNKVK